MGRLTKKWGNNPAVPCKFNLDFIFDMNDKDYLELQAIFEKLAYYEDLEEQGRLEIYMSKEDEKRTLKKMCLNCKYYTGEPCNQTKCPILAKLYD